jgi:hypothetical protein
LLHKLVFPELKAKSTQADREVRVFDSASITQQPWLEVVIGRRTHGNLLSPRFLEFIMVSNATLKMIFQFLQSALLPLLVSLITAYFTSRFVARAETRKQLVIERLGPLLDELSQWVNRLRKAIPPPFAAQQGRDISSNVKVLNDYNDWLSVNIGKMAALSDEVRLPAFAVRDAANDYLRPIERTADQLNQLYDELIEEKLSALARAVVHIHQRVLRG